jgi:polyisoprenyl-teichoic acid--peptidoglycan teichoic acid transferase
MSEHRDDRDGETEDWEADGWESGETGEGSGLGLTEEFARIEAEIEQDLREDAAAGGAVREPGGEDAEDEGPDDADDAGDSEAEAPGESERSEPRGGPAPAAAAAAAGETGEGELSEDLDDEEQEAADDELEQELGDDEEDSEEPAEEEDAEAEEESPEEEGDPEAVSEDRTAVAPAGAAAAAAAGAAAGGAAAGGSAPPRPRAGRPAGVAPPGRPLHSEEELADKTPSLWLRFLAGSVMIIASVATAVAVTSPIFLSDVAAQITQIPGLQDKLETVEPGDPQTIMIIGSDKREGPADLREDGLSDTTMLLRVDPEKEVLSLFSLPRDLKVDIPGVGVNKLNEAYAAGGAKKTLETVKAFTGKSINHVVEIDFQGFADAVNAIECVYVDVDRKYFNDNAGLPPEEQYAPIDINAGYQRLCGQKALDYVRYRHTDTDLVRAARQQDFLREARQKVQPKELLIAPLSQGGTGNELIDIFTDHTESDISNTRDVIEILKSFVAVRDVPVNEVHFEGDIGGPDDPYVTSTSKQVKRAMDEFLNGAGSQGGQRGGSSATDEGKPNKQKRRDKKKQKKVENAAVVPTAEQADPTGKFPTLAERFEGDARKNDRRLKGEIAVFYPTEVVPGSTFSTDSRTYDYKNEQDKREKGYKTVIALSTPSTLTEYYGLMGTTWDDPPILRNPSETRRMGGRELLLFYDAGRLRLVGWRDDGASYWLNNTLSQSIGEPEMLAIASSVEKVG